MLISNMAMMDLGMRRKSILDRARDLLGFSDGPIPSQPETFNQPEPQPVLVAVAEPMELIESADMSHDFRWRRHPQLLRESIATEMSDEERQARKIAIRGLYCAHNGELDEAFLHFVHALGEFRIDLTEMPAFWQMPRGAILGVADAYESVGRYREASMIQARVRTELRPRNVVPMRSARTSPTLRRSAVGD